MTDAQPLTTNHGVSLDWDIEACGPIVLVSVRLDNPTPGVRTIRLRNRLDGPVLPPRRHGVPEQGWDVDGFVGSIPAKGRLAVGYACPVANDASLPCDESPVDVETGVHDSDRNKAEGHEGNSSTPTAVVRDLGDPRPPADAVPLVEEPPQRPIASNPTNGSDATVEQSLGNERDEAGEAARLVQQDEIGKSHPAVEAWFTEIEARVERAEQLDGASVAEATALLRRYGGLSGVEEAEEQRQHDEQLLDAFATRAGELAERAEATEIPLDGLRRLA